MSFAQEIEEKLENFDMDMNESGEIDFVAKKVQKEHEKEHEIESEEDDEAGEEGEETGETGEEGEEADGTTSALEQKIAELEAKLEASTTKKTEVEEEEEVDPADLLEEGETPMDVLADGERGMKFLNAIVKKTLGGVDTKQLRLMTEMQKYKGELAEVRDKHEDFDDYVTEIHKILGEYPQFDFEQAYKLAKKTYKPEKSKKKKSKKKSKVAKAKEREKKLKTEKGVTSKPGPKQDKEIKTVADALNAALEENLGIS